MKIKIAVAYHKEANYVSNHIFIPTQVGAYSNEDLHIQKDSDGENISKQNPYCCELSATYWLWKNVKDADYYGLCHYRRFFSFVKTPARSNFKKKVIYFLAKFSAPFFPNARYTFSRSEGEVIEESELEQRLSEFSDMLYYNIKTKKIKVFCLEKTSLSTSSCMQKLQHCIGILNYLKLEAIIQEVDSNFYLFFKKTMNSNFFYPCNMVIFSKNYFNEYCEIVFSILSQYHDFIEEGLQEGALNNTALRTSGYIGEYLTSAYISYLLDKKIKITTLHTIGLDYKNSGLSLGKINDSLSKRALEVIKT